MARTGLETIDHTVQLTHEWINELDGKFGWENKSRTYRVLRSVLQALRDWLTVDEAAHFGAQLPILLRGVYYEHFHPASLPAKPRNKDAFEAQVQEAFTTDPIDDIDATVATVFEFLSHKITDGEIEDVRSALPASLRALWRRC